MSILDSIRSRRPFCVVTTALALLLCGWATSPAFRASDTSKVQFECFGSGIDAPAKGRFATILTELAIDPNDLSHVTGSVAVDLASVVTNDATWDVLFRAAPFLGIQEYPRSQFEVSQVSGAKALTPGKQVNLTIAGRFSLKGETRPTSFPARVLWSPRTRDAPERLRVEGELKLLWKDYGVRIPSGAAAGFAGEGTNVKLDLSFERNQHSTSVPKTKPSR